MPNFQKEKLGEEAEGVWFGSFERAKAKVSLPTPYQLTIRRRPEPFTPALFSLKVFGVKGDFFKSPPCGVQGQSPWAPPPLGFPRKKQKAAWQIPHRFRCIERAREVPWFPRCAARLPAGGRSRRPLRPMQGGRAVPLYDSHTEIGGKDSFPMRRAEGARRREGFVCGAVCRWFSTRSPGRHLFARFARLPGSPGSPYFLAMGPAAMISAGI